MDFLYVFICNIPRFLKGLSSANYMKNPAAIGNQAFFLGKTYTGKKYFASRVLNLFNSRNRIPLAVSGRITRVPAFTPAILYLSLS